MTRNGKIARLPESIREEINARLANGQEGKEIAEWLNSRPEVQRMVAQEFDGEPVSESNVSRWRAGGYSEWKMMHDAMANLRKFEAKAMEEQDAGKVADQLSLYLTARLAAAIQSSPGTPDDTQAELKLLREAVRMFAVVRKGDIAAHRVEMEQKRNEASTAAAPPGRGPNANVQKNEANHRK